MSGMIPVKGQPHVYRRSFHRTKIPDYEDTKQFLLLKQDHCCNLCLRWCDEADAQIDHVIPVCEGGSNDMWNLQLLHSWCNQEKGVKSMATACEQCTRRFKPRPEPVPIDFDPNFNIFTEFINRSCRS